MIDLAELIEDRGHKRGRDLTWEATQTAKEQTCDTSCGANDDGMSVRGWSRIGVAYELVGVELEFFFAELPQVFCGLFT